MYAQAGRLAGRQAGIPIVVLNQVVVEDKENEEIQMIVEAPIVGLAALVRRAGQEGPSSDWEAPARHVVTGERRGRGHGWQWKYAQVLCILPSSSAFVLHCICTDVCVCVLRDKS